MNNTISISRGYTPFYAARGYNPMMDLLTCGSTSGKSPAADDLVSRLKDIHDTCRKNLLAANAKSDKYV